MCPAKPNSVPIQAAVHDDVMVYAHRLPCLTIEYRGCHQHILERRKSGLFPLILDTAQVIPYFPLCFLHRPGKISVTVCKGNVQRARVVSKIQYGLLGKKTSGIFLVEIPLLGLRYLALFRALFGDSPALIVSIGVDVHLPIMCPAVELFLSYIAAHCLTLSVENQVYLLSVFTIRGGYCRNDNTHYKPGMPPIDGVFLDFPATVCYTLYCNCWYAWHTMCGSCLTPSWRLGVRRFFFYSGSGLSPAASGSL